MILEALSRIEDMKDFRLKDFMQRMGLDPRQPVLFYRRLIKEAREAVDASAHTTTRISRLELENTGLKQQIRKDRAAAQTARQWRSRAEEEASKAASYKSQAAIGEREVLTLKRKLGEANLETAQLRNLLQESEAKTTLYERVLLFMFQKKLFYPRWNPKGWNDYVFPEFVIPNRVNQLVLVMEPENPSITLEPYELSYLTGLIPSQTVDRVIKAWVGAFEDALKAGDLKG